MAGDVRVPPPSWACDTDGLKDAVVRVVAREREFCWAAQGGTGGDVRQASEAVLDAWETLAEVVGADVVEMLRAADRVVTGETS